MFLIDPRRRCSETEEMGPLSGQEGEAGLDVFVKKRGASDGREDGIVDGLLISLATVSDNGGDLSRLQQTERKAQTENIV